MQTVDKFKQDLLEFWKLNPECIFDDKNREKANKLWELILRLPDHQAIPIAAGLLMQDDPRWVNTEGFIDFARKYPEEEWGQTLSEALRHFE